MNSDPKSKRVFISYSHDSPEHEKRVLDLCIQLRDWGVDCWIDQYETFPAQGWHRWMVQEIKKADFVLCVFTENYRRRFEAETPPDEGRGVKFEGLILSQIIYGQGGYNSSILPIHLDGGKEADISIVFRTFSHFRVPPQFEKLFRYITNQPEIVPKPIGPLKTIA